jgi:hypothetical protein
MKEMSALLQIGRVRSTCRTCRVSIRRSAVRVIWMRATVVGLVTPHLLRIVDLAIEAEKGVNVDWHLRDAVAKTMRELGDQYNAPALVASYVEGLETAAGQAASTRVAYVGVLQAAAAAARALRRD